MNRFLQKTRAFALLCVVLSGSSLLAQTDMTSLLVNPSFETGNATGWTWTGTTGYAWLGPNNDGDATKDGTYVNGLWNASIGDVECAQSVTGLPAGYYKITGLMTVSNGRLTNHRLFAATTLKTNSQLYGASDHVVYSAANLAILSQTESYTFGGYTESTRENGAFKKLSVISKVTDGNLKLGIRLSGKSNTAGYDFSYTNRGDAGFFKFDGFTLTEVSSVATLDNITLNTGTLDAAFSASTTTYTATLPIGTTSVTPSVVPSVDGTTVSGTDAVDVTSGSGQSVISVVSLDSTVTKTYTINYTVLSLSNDATLSQLSVDMGVLTPVFNPSITSYQVKVPRGTNSLLVTAVKNDAKASFTGGGQVNLVNGKDTVDIVVTAENNTQKTYTVYIDQDYIVNPGFETGNFTGWTWTGTTGYAWVGVGTSNDETVTGSNIAGTWNWTYGDVQLSQTITELPNAIYKVTADLMGSSNNTTSRLTTQRLFANNHSMLFGAESSYSEGNLTLLGATETYSFGGYTETANDDGPFKTLTVLVPVTDGTLTLGIRTNGKSSALGYTFPNLTAGDGHGWFKVDNFTMTYYAANPSTSVSENESKVSVKMYNNQLEVAGTSAYTVYNLQGMMMKQVTSNASGVKVDLNNGIYLVKTYEGKVIKIFVN